MSTSQTTTQPDRRSRRPRLVLGLAAALVAGSAITIAVSRAGADSSARAGDDTVASTDPADTADTSDTVDSSATTSTHDASKVFPLSTLPPVTTAPVAPPTAPTAPAPQPTPPSAPAFGVVNVNAPSVFVCSEAPGMDPQTQLTVSWTTTGAASVTVSIDSPNGVWMNNLPANGSTVVPAPCAGDTNTYYVTAVSSSGATDTKSVTTEGR